MPEKIAVLFICIHNSARSQMAEAYLHYLAPKWFDPASAGLAPGLLNPAVVEVMMEEGIDISKNKTKGIRDIMSSGKKYDYVITVCDEASASQCPVFPGGGEMIHWRFDDPSSLAGTDDEILEGTRIIRDKIKNKVECWIKTIQASVMEF